MTELEEYRYKSFARGVRKSLANNPEHPGPCDYEAKKIIRRN